MANNGYISSSGINQIFTTGPYTGSVVTSSYSTSDGILFGPPIDFFQSFISGTIDEISTCNDVFKRYYYDPINCPPGDCLAPIALSATVANCTNYDYNYYFYFNSSSAAAEYSTIEYSTFSDFSSNTGSLIVTNSVGYRNLIDISNLGLLPIKTSNVYFRVFNSCSINGTSSYSNIVSASCQTPPPPTTPTFTVRLKNSMVGTNNALYYTYNGTEYVLFGNPYTSNPDIFKNNTVNLDITTLSSLDIPFKTLFPDNNVYTVIATASSTDLNGVVYTSLNDSTPQTFYGDVNQETNIYPYNFYYNTKGTPDASITIDRSLWNNSGLIEIKFTNLTPSEENNPWGYTDTGGGGGQSYY